MSNITKAIAALGVVASLGVTTLPLSTYAVETGSAETSAVPVVAKVNNSISVTVDTAEINLGTVSKGGPVSEATVNVTVSTTDEDGYSLKVDGAGTVGTKTSLYRENTDGTFDTTNKIATGAPTKGTTTAWGVKTQTKAYSAIGNGDLVDSEEQDETTAVTFGLSISSSEANVADGTYRGAVVFIATGKTTS